MEELEEVCRINSIECVILHMGRDDRLYDEILNRATQF